MGWTNSQIAVNNRYGAVLVTKSWTDMQVYELCSNVLHAWKMNCGPYDALMRDAIDAGPWPPKGEPQTQKEELERLFCHPWAPMCECGGDGWYTDPTGASRSCSHHAEF